MKMIRELADKVKQKAGKNSVDYQVPLSVFPSIAPRQTYNKGGKVYKNVNDMESKCQSKK